jgi:hypothetical protein
MNENKISIEIITSDLADINSAVQTLLKKLEPYLIALNADDKKGLAKIGERNLPYVEKTLQYAVSNPEFLPPYIDVNEFKKDFEAFRVLRELLRPLAQITSNIDDTATLCGSEAIDATSAYYGSVSQAAKLNVPNAKAIYDDLSQRFEAQKVKKNKAKMPK